MENSVTSDIDIEEALAKIQIPENLSVRVGILDGATNEQGDLIAPYAAANELGATIHVPEQQRDMNFRIAKNGKSRFSTLSKANFQENVAIPAHTVAIPPRPFLRSTVAEKGKNWANALKFQLVQQGVTADSVKLALTAVGEMAAKDVRSTIQKGVNPANAPSTIKQKQRRGNADPEHTLVNTGSMQAAISYGVDDES